MWPEEPGIRIAGSGSSNKNMAKEYDGFKREINKNEKKQNKLLYIILLVIFAVVLSIVSVIMLRDKHVEKSAEEVYRDLGAQGDRSGDLELPYVESEDSTLSALGIKIPDKELDWDLMKETNEDIYAWIYIPEPMWITRSSSIRKIMPGI